MQNRKWQKQQNHETGTGAGAFAKTLCVKVLTNHWGRCLACIRCSFWHFKYLQLHVSPGFKPGSLLIIMKLLLTMNLNEIFERTYWHKYRVDFNEEHDEVLNNGLCFKQKGINRVLDQYLFKSIAGQPDSSAWCYWSLSGQSRERKSILPAKV